MVEEFIERFKGAQDTFLYGCCYWFAVILQERFKGRIVYDQVENHFATEIFGRCYDVTGDITNLYHFEYWDKFEDDLLKSRIIRDCVM